MNKRNKKVNELNWSRKEKFQPCVIKAKLSDRFIKIKIVSAVIIYISSILFLKNHEQTYRK